MLQLPAVFAVEFEDAFLGVVKGMFVLGALLYVAYAVIVVRQEKLMSQTLETSFGYILRLLGLFHLILSLIVLFYFMTAL
jgi:hypothetical protein